MATVSEDETLEDSGSDLFEDWYHAPVTDSAAVPGFHVRHSTPDDFGAIWDLVDDAFGVRQPRPLYEWLYRKNPRGPARCFNVIEDATTKQPALVRVTLRFRMRPHLGSPSTAGVVTHSLPESRRWGLLLTAEQDA